MQVDWITTIAQIINFLVLVYLLKRFLYGPIVSAMIHREAHIAERVVTVSVETGGDKDKLGFEHVDKIGEFSLDHLDVFAFAGTVQHEDLVIAARGRRRVKLLSGIF